MSNFRALSGDDLENWFENFLKNEMGFNNYFPSTGQILQKDLGLTDNSDYNIEIDGVMLVNKTIIYHEFTAENPSRPKDKINKFLKNNYLFKSSPLTIREKLAFFSIPSNIIDDFEEATDEYHIIWGTSNAFDQDFNSGQFPSYPSIAAKLSVFNSSKIDYYYRLSSLIKQYSKNEFLEEINVTTEYEFTENIIHKKFIKLTNKYVTKDEGLKADLYMSIFKVSELLNIAKVARYENVPLMITDEDSDGNYQRMIAKNKLNKIATDFINNNKRKIFPTNITLVSGIDCQEVTINDEKRFAIPNKYGVLSIIDGQHRLFSYAQDSINYDVREQGEISVSIIKFDTEDKELISKYAAKVFCEINSNQTSIKSQLIYLIKYDILGDRDSKALAGKIVLTCNKIRKSDALHGVFLVNILQGLNKYNAKPIPVTTIINQGIEPIVKLRDDTSLSDANFRTYFGIGRTEALNDHDKFVKEAGKKVSISFNKIKSVFNKDWHKSHSANSYLMTARYITAFLQFMVYMVKIENKHLDSEFENALNEIKNNIIAYASISQNATVFDRSNTNIIPVSEHVNKIFEFIQKAYKNTL